MAPPRSAPRKSTGPWPAPRLEAAGALPQAWGLAINGRVESGDGRISERAAASARSKSTAWRSARAEGRQSHREPASVAPTATAWKGTSGRPSFQCLPMPAAASMAKTPQSAMGWRTVGLSTKAGPAPPPLGSGRAPPSATARRSDASASTLTRARSGQRPR